jgi:hypothetical protein
METTSGKGTNAPQCIALVQDLPVNYRLWSGIGVGFGMTIQFSMQHCQARTFSYQSNADTADSKGLKFKIYGKKQDN